MANTKKAPGDDGHGYRYALSGMPSQQFQTKPAVGEIWEASVKVRVTGYTTREMATEGIRESVNLKALEITLVEIAEAEPEGDPNQPTLDSVADPDNGDFEG